MSKQQQSQYEKETENWKNHLQEYIKNTEKEENKIRPEFRQAEIEFRQEIIASKPEERKELVKIFTDYEKHRDYISNKVNNKFPEKSTNDFLSGYVEGRRRKRRLD